MLNLKEVCKGAKHIGISGHIRPDGDCVGSAMALYLYLKKICKEAQITVMLEKPPVIFDCIREIEQINTSFSAEEPFDVFFALDTVKDRMGEAEAYFDGAAVTVNIDHHISNNGCGDINYIDPLSGSTSELIYRLLDKKEMDVEIAKAVYIGIIHDTGVLQYSNTTPETLRIVADLMEYGFDFSGLIDRTFYEKTYIQNQILGRAILESILFLKGRCIASAVDRKTMDFYGAKSSDLEGIVNQLRVVKGVDCAIFMYQTDILEFKVSMRSNGNVNVAEVASYFGGGGHIRAAGCNMQGTYHDVINNLSLHIERQLKENNRL